MFRAMTKRVLITGCDGAIGRAAARALKSRGHFVRGFDLRHSELADEAVVGSLVDLELMKVAALGMDVVIHLAATVDDADFMTELLPNNVVGLWNVLEAARLAGVKRVSLASSMQVVSAVKREPGKVMRVEELPGPRNHYAATKLFAEDMGLLYVNRYGMEVICPRIGWLPRNPEDTRRLVKHGGQNSYLSHDDAGRFYVRVVEAEQIEGQKAGYAVVFLLSKRTVEGGPDMEAARRAVGYVAEDLFPAGLPFEF
jgi:nucleoside-diphosphate-sugar epimerase